ncbi:recombinase family protein [Cesiribacter sp. SM1]|uniref:recombinase family protein n=1 Tax=Cesiribacter sp. SM1 TaxID=2861196 RepID=UPI001CD3EF76|nr:recombinase family protein [Cesiribacter sp. SM1]
MLIGYARVSTVAQNSDLQLDALQQAGCEKIFTDKISGAVADRPALSKAKEMLRKGDTLVVWRLDRLGRSLRDLIDWMNYLDKEGIALKSLQESIDTSTATGKLIFHIFASMAEFERNLIKERTEAGLHAARARGRVGGRPSKLNSSKRELAVKLYNSREHSVDQICEMMGITKPTLYSYVRAKNK